MRKNIRNAKSPYNTYQGRLPYKKVYRHGMDKNTKQILWTALWLMFISGLCILFNSAGPLWLLFFWFIGIL